MTQYVIEFDLAAVVLSTVLLIVFVTRPAIPNHTRYYFLAVLILLLGASTTDALGSHLLNVHARQFWHLSYVMNGLYVCFIGVLALTYANYVVTLCIKGRRGFFRRIIINMFGAMLLILDATSPLTKLMYYLDDQGNYYHGPLMFLQYVIAIIVLIYVTILCLTKRKEFSRAQWIGSLCFTFYMLCGFLVQLFIPHYLVTCFSAAIGLCYVAFTIEDPNEHIDISTGCFNKKALGEVIDRSIDYGREASFMVFGLHEYENLRVRLDLESLNKAVRDGADKLRKYYGPMNVFYLGNAVFAIRDKTGNEDAYDMFCADVVRNYFDTPVDFGFFASKLSPYVVIAPLYDNVKDGRDYVRVLEYAIDKKKDDSSNTVKYLEREDFEGLGRRYKVLNAIKKAVALNGFEVYYQPIYSTETMSFSKAEALVRLNDPELGFISPEEFIPIAEKTGYIVQIGEMVMKKVCRFMDESDIARFGVESVDVNLSPIQCLEEDLYKTMLKIMATYNVDPSQIDFEITETAYSDEEALFHNMSKLIESGAKFSMDDYGTGFSNTQMLIKFPLDIVKIDKSILWNAMEDERAKILLTSTIRTIREIGCKTVVEGVETQGMVDLLTEEGVEYLQGYFYSEPIKEKEYLEFLTTGF